MPSRYFPMYNIDQPVGPNKPNQPDDVRLIQALFIEIARFDAKDWLANVPVENRMLTTSGLFDDTLRCWILEFQTWHKKAFGLPVVDDGIIDPMPIDSIAVSPHFKTGVISTLAFLCNRLWRWNRSVYLRIGDDYHVRWVPGGWENT